MIIAQISDTHIDLDSPQSAVRRRNLERCVDDINVLDPLPDVVIHTGDLAQKGNPEEYEEAKKILCDLRAPLYVAVGNRDDRGALRTAFPANGYLLPDAPFVQYRVDEFPVRLMVLDTLSENSNKGDFCAIRADSLCAALADDMTKPTAVCMHHPPFEVVESAYPDALRSVPLYQIHRFDAKHGFVSELRAAGHR